MKTVLFIGNGFDLNLGLQTRYIHFYRYYLAQKTNDENLLGWKRKISANLDLWSDLEEHIRTIGKGLDDSELEGFLLFIEDLTEELSNYLDLESTRIQFDDQRSTCSAFFHGIRRIDEIIKQNVPSPKMQASIKAETNAYTFLNFNYTTSLEKIIRTQSHSHSIIHPHGDLALNLVLGTSDLPLSFYERKGITGNSPISRDEFRKWVVKENIVQQDKELKQRFSKSISAISQSDVICIYGMSMGSSDMMWWDAIVKWLLDDQQHHLIIFSHALDYTPHTRVPRRQYTNRGEQIKERFLQNCSMFKNPRNLVSTEDIIERIIVIQDKDIFTMKIQENTRSRVPILSAPSN